MSTTYIRLLALFVLNQEEIAPRILVGQDNISGVNTPWAELLARGLLALLRWKSFNFKPRLGGCSGQAISQTSPFKVFGRVCVANIHYSAW